MEKNGSRWGWGEKHKFREKQGGKSKGGWRPGWQTPRWPNAGWPESQENESFVLRTYIVGGMGVKKLLIDWLINVLPAFPGGGDHPNLNICGGLLAQILVLLQTPFVHLVLKQISDRRQLIKVAVVTQSYLWALFWALQTLSHISGLV